MTTQPVPKSETDKKIMSVDEEQIKHLEKRPRNGLSPEEEEFLLNVDEKEARKIFRKIDMRLVPMLALLYLFSHLDRANIGKCCCRR